MFGNINEKVDKLIEKKQWTKILMNLKDASEDNRVKIARACSEMPCNDTHDILSVLLNDYAAESPALLTEILASFAKAGNDKSITILRYFREKLPAAETASISAIDETIRMIKKRA